MSALEITNSRRILLVGQRSSGKLAFLKALTGSLPPTTSTSPAGMSHALPLTTPYYKTTVPIWIDEIPSTSPNTWSSTYLSAEAHDVLHALGAFILTFRKPSSEVDFARIREVLRAVQRIVKGCGYAWDGVCLAVGMPQSLQPRLELELEVWEEMCRECGFEFVDFEVKARNEFGENAGMERVREALEANDWAADDETGDGDGEDGEDDGGSFGSFSSAGDGGEGMDPLKFIGDEMEREMFGLHRAIFGDEESTGESSVHGITDDDDDEDEEAQVEKLETMMMRMTALKDMGEEVSKQERRRVAAKALSDIMKSS
ncbi:hypothetical protein C7212DRAFT_206551 [Tuber magnatum]|uniref:Increased recombination centers protein 6 n=1 Tax=Tuber magnatum TaxID=42249 RepID=A0A317SK76_9PEZI|nr:hypothetical protein C7212DRAFT_206551 [Tuber magnatum]